MGQGAVEPNRYDEVT